MSSLVVHERPGDGPTVLALHGMTSTAGVWADLERRLPGRHLVAPNLPGRGPSRGVTARRGLMGLADAVVDLAVRSPWAAAGETVVVGHSMGAFLAPVVVRRLVDAGLGVRGVLLLDGGPRPTPSRLTRPLVVRALFSVVALKERSTLSFRAPSDAVDCLTRPTRLGVLNGLDLPVHLIAAAHGAGPDKPEFLSGASIDEGLAALPRMTWERLDATHESMLSHPAVAEAVKRW
ncbi:alpha/beta fold hydrolase [Kineosporia succinea]|uniref:Pimeloyl-ACP methyl ester carboxylesterase n=1 Tax=Kineosporia succinea TaxID=84632 RepID=A0ABT9NXX3_9ACTN|nr:alpha/beta fold hydrolase [Kineosporia succinea]MDP9825283.1 pimeloyl-ACP methyl ester carboxylesterase [Kineosporia succinea]